MADGENVVFLPYQFEPESDPEDAEDARELRPQQEVSERSVTIP